MATFLGIKKHDGNLSRNTNITAMSGICLGCKVVSNAVADCNWSIFQAYTSRYLGFASTRQNYCHIAMIKINECNVWAIDDGNWHPYMEFVPFKHALMAVG